MLNGTEESWNPVSGSNIYLHRQRLCLTKEGRRVDLLTLSEHSESEMSELNAKVCVETSPPSCLEQFSPDPSPGTPAPKDMPAHVRFLEQLCRGGRREPRGAVSFQTDRFCVCPGPSRRNARPERKG